MERIDFREFLIVNQIRVPYSFIERSIVIACFFGALAIPSVVATAATTQYSPENTPIFLGISALLVIFAYVAVFVALSSVLKMVYRTMLTMHRISIGCRSWQEFRDRLICWQKYNRKLVCDGDEQIRVDRVRTYNIVYRRFVKRWGNTI